MMRFYQRVQRVLCLVRNLRLLVMAASLVLALEAQQMQMNVEQLADFIRSELALKQHKDKEIAAYVRKIQLTEKLTDKTITDLEAQGAGEKTVQALQDLRDRTASMKPPTQDATYSPATAPDNTLTNGPETIHLGAKAPPIPPPNSIRQKEILELMKQYALNYTENLPNFLCVEVTRQYVDPNARGSYRSIGNILARVAYNEGREHYNVYSVNGQMVDTTMEGLNRGGAISTGEFGSLMREIFEPRSEAEFNWDHWGTLRGRRMAVFNYYIDSGHSGWSIRYSDSPGDEQRIITAYKGLVYADPNTGEIDRIKFIAVDIPRSFPVTDASEILDYDLVEISGQKYVVPLAAQLWMKALRGNTKNEIEFRNYRKFGTDTEIKYDMDAVKREAPLPASAVQEQPAGTPAAAPPNNNPGNSAARQTPAKAPTPGTPTTAAPAGTSSPWELPSAPPPPPPQQ